MKLTTLILFITLMQVSAATLAQKVTLSEKNAPLSVVIDQISKQTGYDFIVTGTLLRQAKPITLDIQNEELASALRKVFLGQPFDYEVRDKTVLLKLKEPGVMEKIKSYFAAIDVKGKVVDESNAPLPGATVKIKNTDINASTDATGNFTLNRVEPGAILVISFIGYDRREIAAQDADGKTITLKIAQNNLKEVVINKGYYNTSQELNTGDVSHVSAKEIGEQPVSNPLAALEGRVPGLFINQQSGNPGGGYTVRIRGQNSLINGNDPLYIVDGVPYGAQMNLSAGATVISGSPLNYINPEDIESIDVLKDADATAIYGSRGANGVMLITTKKGKAGDTRVSFNVSSGVGDVARKFDLVSPDQYYTMRREAIKNDGLTVGQQDYDLNGYWDPSRTTDWQKLMIGNTSHYDHYQGDVSGGSANVQYLFGGAFHRETTVFPTDLADNKGEAHFNLTASSNDRKFNAQFSASYTGDHNNLISYDPTSSIFGLAPDAPPVYNADGSLNWANSTWGNPLAYFQSKYILRTRNLVSNGLLSYLLAPGLVLRTSLGYTDLAYNETLTYPTTYFDPAYGINQGSATFADRNTSTWIVEPQLNYDRQIGRGKLNVLVGTTFQQTLTEGKALNANGYTDNSVLESIQGAATITKGAVANTDYKYNAVYGRISYNWAETYILNATGRRDGSSRFGPGNQFGNFGAIGAAWIFSNENFVKKALPFLSFGKLRASYGTSGNDQIPDYQYLSLYNFTALLPYQNATGIYPSNLFNSNFAWERNQKLEGGLELGFLDQRLYLTASWFRNRSSNQLLGYSLPDVTGFTFVFANLPATVQNTGTEFTLNSVNIKSKDFRWSSSFNLTIPVNKVVAFPGLATSPYATQYLVGQPINVARVFHSNGVDPATGLYQFTDAKGNVTANPQYTVDNTTNISTAPKYYGGLQNSLRYRGFELTFLLQFVKQTGLNALFNPRVPGVIQTMVLEQQYQNHWVKPGDHATYEKYTSSYSSDAYNALQYAINSDLAYTDASYIRLKNASLSYTFGDELLKHIKVRQARIFLQGQNLLTFTHYLGADPETQSTNNLPPLRILTAGFQLTL